MAVDGTGGGGGVVPDAMAAGWGVGDGATCCGAGVTAGMSAALVVGADVPTDPGAITYPCASTGRYLTACWVGMCWN